MKTEAKSGPPFFTLWFFLAALIGAGGFLIAGRPSEERGAGIKAVEILVEPGDTLWTIAAKSAPDLDPRLTIEWIIRANRLVSTALLPGQRLLVPRGEPGADGESTMCLRGTEGWLRSDEVSKLQAREVEGDGWR